MVSSKALYDICLLLRDYLDAHCYEYNADSPKNDESHPNHVLFSSFLLLRVLSDGFDDQAQPVHSDYDDGQSLCYLRIAVFRDGDPIAPPVCDASLQAGLDRVRDQRLLADVIWLHLWRLDPCFQLATEQ